MNIEQLVRERFIKTEFTAFDTGWKPSLRDGRLIVPRQCIEALADEAFSRITFFHRKSHLELLEAASGRADTTENERVLIHDLLENAVIASAGRLPICQDTGVACVYAWKDEGVITEADDLALLAHGITGAYTRRRRLRASIVAPVSFFDEYNTGNNMPAQIHIEATPLESALSTPSYRFLFVAKGGGSSNKTSYFPASPDILSDDEWDRFLVKKIEALGTAACPPYRLAIVVGGLSPEQNLEVLKLATTEILDGAPYFRPDLRDSVAFSAAAPNIFRDRFWEKRAQEIAERSGLGAQVGGKRLVLDVRVLRLPRHAASCPISIGVSCVAHRNIMGLIDRNGVFLENLEENPAALLKNTLNTTEPVSETRRVSFDMHIAELCDALSHFRAGDTLLASGKLLVARDAAHFAWRKLLKKGGELPEYLFKYPVFYAGPSETPSGCVTGSIGPTTSSRMDGFAEELLSRGASLVTIGKGRRSALWTEAAGRYGGRYLIAAGGAAALIASRNIVSTKIIDYPKLEMEAVRLLEVKDLRLFVG